jgi:cobyrinic acid a,c-diamide synthase
MTSSELPRLLIAGTASGVGKTTVVVGLTRALRARGLRVAVFKCGPDYLDPTYHARAAGRPSQNLDGWMMGRDAVLATFARAASGMDIALVEGVMGLFDGASPTSEEGSAAEIAKWLDAPVLVVVDASGMARTIAAIAHGFAGYDREIKVAGLVANRVGSRGHLELLRQAEATLPIVGGLPEDPALRFPERHLGLVRADEAAVSDAVLDLLGERVREWLDVDTILDLARGAASLPPATEVRPKAASACRIGIAFDDAFHFYYEDNLRRLEEQGAELVRFSPIRDRALPDVDGLYLGGGYPEAHAEALSQNRQMLEDVRALAVVGGPIYAECGGLMYLSEGIRTLDGRLHPMVGLVAGRAAMRDRLQSLGYVEVETRERSLLGPAGLRFRGHEFRYSELEAGEPGDARLYTVRRRWNGATFQEGYLRGSVLASYVHAHWASNPAVAQAFVEACARHARRG